jgi:RimJ/RimL family protein N-acetyltransferase
MTTTEPPASRLAPSLRASRLALRALAMTDAPAIARHANDPDVARMTTGIPLPYTLDLAEKFVERAGWGDAAREALFAVEAIDGDAGAEVVGLVGFHPNDEGATEIGYWLGRPFWGRGYMTEAVCAAMAWAGGAWGRRYIVSGYFADNPASGRVLVKAGFLPTGEVRWRLSLARGEAARTRMMIWLA